MHLARGVPLGKIQLGEVVVVGLDVRTFGHREAHVGEDGGEFVPGLAQRMDAAGVGRRVAQRQGDVDGLRGEARVERRVLQDVAARGQRLRHRVLGEIDLRALRLAFVRRHLAERREQRRDRALLAERRNAHGFERGLVGSGCDVSEDLGLQSFEIGHGWPPPAQRHARR